MGLITGIEDTFSVQIIFVVAILLLSLAYWYLTIPRNLPPGPSGLPFVGYIPFLGEFPPDTFAKLGKKYGSVFSFYLGSRLTVVLNDYNVIHEAYIKQSDKFSCRPYDFAPCCGIDGYIFNDNIKWKAHRKFAIKYMKYFGVGRSDMEPKIMIEVTNLISTLETHVGEPMDISNKISICVANITCNMLFGETFSPYDAKFLNIIQLYDQKFLRMGNTATWNYFPWMKEIPGFKHLLGFEKLKELAMHLLFLMQKKIDRHKETQQIGNESNFVAAYLTEMDGIKTSEGKNLQHFNEKHLSMCLDVLFEGGSETTKSWLIWAIMHMMIHPDIQKKVQAEIDENIGRERYPQYSDRLITPYTEATILEVGRISTIIPLNLARGNSMDATINGFHIPKQTLILSNLWNVHFDPALWSDPEEFKPERFLSENGELQTPEFYIPFSIGKLNCFGEGLARMELYLFFASLMQKFTFKIPNGEHISAKGTFGISYAAKQYKTIIELRY